MSAATPYNNALQYMNQGDWEKALSYLNQALDMQPDQPNYLSDRGVVYFQMGKKDLAMIDLNRALQLDNRNPYRYSSRAFVKDSVGDTEGAIEDYKRAIELDPKDAVAYNNLGLLEEKLGYQKMAKERFDKADTLADGKKSTLQKEKFIPLTNSSPISEKKLEDENSHFENKRTTWHYMKHGIFSKEGRKELLQFIKNGFKLK